MTVPRGMGNVARTVADMVRGMVPHARQQSLSKDEMLVGVHLRGNDGLLEGLQGIIESRIGGRGRTPVPSDPIDCKSMLERDRELRWLLGRLELICKSPVLQPATDDEQPE